MNGGAVPAWAAQRERSNPLALRLITWIARRLGRAPARLLLYPIVGYFLLTSREACTSSRRYLRRILGRDPGVTGVARHLHSFAATLLDRVFALTGRFDLLDIRIRGAEALLRHTDAGRGCLLLGSHLGSFEMLRCLAASRPDLRVKALMHRDRNAMIMRVTGMLNPAIMQEIIDTGPRDTDLVFKVQEALEQGCCVGLLGDRAYPGERLVRCRFLGGQVDFPAAPLLLASLLRVPVILCFGLYRGGNRYDIHFEELAGQIVIERRQREAELQRWVQHYADRLAHYAQMAPYNWFNFYDYWQEDHAAAAHA